MTEPNPPQEPMFDVSQYGQSGPWGQVPPPPVEVTRPRSLDLAVLLMRIGALVGLLQVLIGLTTRDAVRDAALRGAATSGTPLSPEELDAVVGLFTAIALVAGLVGAGLWLWMASANGNGRSWARVVATVLFAISVLSTVSSLFQAGTLLTRVPGLVQLVLGGVIIVLLYRPESSDYYRAKSAPGASSTPRP